MCVQTHVEHVYTYARTHIYKHKCKLHVECEIYYLLRINNVLTHIFTIRSIYVYAIYKKKNNFYIRVQKFNRMLTIMLAVMIARQSKGLKRSDSSSV